MHTVLFRRAAKLGSDADSLVYNEARFVTGGAPVDIRAVRLGNGRVMYAADRHKLGDGAFARVADRGGLSVLQGERAQMGHEGDALGLALTAGAPLRR